MPLPKTNANVPILPILAITLIVMVFDVSPGAKVSVPVLATETPVARCSDAVQPNRAVGAGHVYRRVLQRHWTVSASNAGSPKTPKLSSAWANRVYLPDDRLTVKVNVHTPGLVCVA